jgi:hypothetical protein
MTLGAAPRAKAELMANGADAATSSTIAARTLTNRSWRLSPALPMSWRQCLYRTARNGPRQINPEHAALIPRID